MYLKKLVALGVAAVLVGCGGDVSDFGTDNSPGTVTVTGTASNGETLSASLSDPDGIQVILAYQWWAGDEQIDGADSDTYTLTVDEIGDSVESRVVYTDNDGITSTAISSGTDPVEGVAPATFEGLEVSIFNDEPETTGMITVTDPNPGEGLVIGQADVATEFGTFSIMPNGDWESLLESRTQPLLRWVQTMRRPTPSR